MLTSPECFNVDQAIGRKINFYFKKIKIVTVNCRSCIYCLLLSAHCYHKLNMINKLLKSLRKFVCSKLKTYKRNRYRAIQPTSSPASDLIATKDLGRKCTCDNAPKNVTHHTIVIAERKKEQNICHKPAQYTRNPFFNYLREFRRTHCGMTIVEQAIQAGAEWRCMTTEEKCKYVVHTDGKPRRRRRYKRRSIYWIKRKEI